MVAGTNARRSGEERSDQALCGRIGTPYGVIDDGGVRVVADRIAEMYRAHPDDECTPRAGVLVSGCVHIHRHRGGGASSTSAEPEKIAAAADDHSRRATPRWPVGPVTGTSDPDAGGDRGSRRYGPSRRDGGASSKGHSSARAAARPRTLITYEAIATSAVAVVHPRQPRPAASPAAWRHQPHPEHLTRILSER